MSISFIVVSSTGWFEVGKDAMGDACVDCIGVRSNRGLISGSWRSESKRMRQFTRLLMAEEVGDERTTILSLGMIISEGSVSRRSVGAC